MTDNSSLHIIQANLQRSQLATTELLQWATDKGVSLALVQEPYVGRTGQMKQHPGTKIIQCTLNRAKPVKAAIIVFGDRLRVIHDPQLVTETEAAVLLEAGTLKLGVVSVYFEGDQDIEPYLVRTKALSTKLKTKHLLVGGDVNAWSHWWGSNSDDQRGEAYNNLLNEMELQILNRGDTPTFETYRNDRIYKSIVDVTACSLSLLGRITNWRVDREIITSDHNAITFTLRLEEKLTPISPPTTRRYKTKKVQWSTLQQLFSAKLAENNITCDVVGKIKTREDLESITEAYVKTIQGVCDTAIPKVGKQKVNAKAPWWSSSLEQLRSDVLRKKRRIRNAAPHRKAMVIQEYIAAKNSYADKVFEAKTESWKKFCSTQDKESMWDGIYRVIRRTAGRQEDTLLRSANGETLSPTESADLLADTFYPGDSVETDKNYHTKIRELVQEKRPEDIRELSADDPPFTDAELDSVLKALNPKKAPGWDGLTADICTAAIQGERNVFMAIANKCLSLAHFPTQWKVAHVVILRKPGKADYTHPKSYRPIGLLPVLGKIVEKLMVNRIMWHTLPTLNPKQYGFIPQRGTEDALYDLMEHVRSGVNNKKIVVMVSLDIEGAFDNAWWPALKLQLIKRKCPKNIYAMVDSYLRDRKIMVNYAGATSERHTTKGCVQGSIGGPTFWNIILDSLLQTLTDQGVYCQAFADDVVLVFTGQEVSVLEESANAALQTVERWGKRSKLNFAAHKTKVMVLTKKLKYDPPLLNMSGKTLDLVDELKLLGLIIDRKLTFKPHVTAVCKKTADIYKQLACAAKVTWGLNPEIIRTIYVAVIEPIVLYAASAWYQTTELQLIRNKLDALQRCFALKICKAYRTVSLTSALVLSGLLPLDLRIQEAANLYMAKKGLSKDYLPPGRELEQRVRYLDLPHPSKLTTTEFELLDDADSETSDRHKRSGPQIYTDGSKIEGKVGAAATWWEGDGEKESSTFSLAPSCTVFQAEMYALYRAVLMAKASRDETISILSDSRSSLDLLAAPKVTHPIAKCIKESMEDIKSEGRQVKLFWLRAHVGTAGNERADELAKTAALQSTDAPDYDKVPLSYVKRTIREETVRKWQDRYNSSSTGSTTKVFFPDVDRAYRVVRGTKLTPLQVQILTGHGGIAEYLHRFKLKDSPGCECDPSISESVWHLVLDCPRFEAARTEVEAKTNTKLVKSDLHNMLADANKRPHFLEYAGFIARIAANRNKTTTNYTNTTTSADPVTQSIPPVTGSPKQAPVIHIIHHGERGSPGIRTRGVAMFMDNNTEKLGISFCRATAQKWVTISPGLALLLNGSTSKISLKRKKYNELQTATVADQRCRVVRVKNKVVALFEMSEQSTCFAQACSALASFGENSAVTPKKISVDAMVVAYEKGEVKDYIGLLKASEHHEVVAYEDRGENLNFLKPRRPESPPAPIPVDSWGHPIVNPELSGSERLQQRVAREKGETRRSKATPSASSGRLAAISDTISQACTSIPEAVGKKVQGLLSAQKMAAAVQKFTKRSPKGPAGKTHAVRTKADMGLVSPPELRRVAGPLDHLINAFLEFIAVTKATREVCTQTCESILRTYHRGNDGLLAVKLEEARAAVYDNDNSLVIKGKMSGEYMAAYSGTGGFVARDEEESRRTGRQVFITPTNDPIVVVAKCTEVMLDDRILKKAEDLPKNPSGGEPFGHWDMPLITWVEGVPGCGKTTWVVNNFKVDGDIVITTTTQAAEDLREKLTQREVADVKTRVRTMASMLVNGVKAPGSCTRVIVDEALMNHFGAIVMAIRLAGASEVLLIGDRNQLPFIDRNNLFQMLYHRPDQVARVEKELLCTHRNPMDVAYALREIYGGIYSSKTQTRSLTLKRYTDAQIPKTLECALYLTHTQAEKAMLKQHGYGTGQGSRVLTIHEAQGLTTERVVIVRTEAAPGQICGSVPHAVVAISRHTGSCVYYSDNTEGDAIARFIQRTESADAASIVEYNLKMAMRCRDYNSINKYLT